MIMNESRVEVQCQKNLIINSLLNLGVYKKGNKQLYELTLHELKIEYQTAKSCTNHLSF
ncbi:Fur-regulated basic protein FbpA [Priestia megaterium]|nr:Fur-regulated basic protein FbpA [Priestia megaterium]